jgi:hypothetical protein
MSGLFWFAIGFALSAAWYERERLKAFADWLRSKSWESK